MNHPLRLATGSHTYANAAANASTRLEYAHKAIDAFQRHTGHTNPTIEPPVIAAAIERMLTTTG
jgi:hypothetical protein